MRRVAQISGTFDVAQEIRQRADVVLVRVREHDGAHTVWRFSRDTSKSGQDEIDAEMLVAREREPRVDDDDLAAELVDRHVLADLAEAAERDDPQRTWPEVSLRERHKGEQDSPVRGGKAAAVISIL